MSPIDDFRRSLNLRRWSLKNQIRALGVLALGTLVLAVVLGVFWFNETTAARVADAVRQLERAGAQLVNRYEELRRRSSAGLLPEGDLLERADTAALTALTGSVLASAPGVEGGFYASSSGRLLGYAYPTYPGSGPKTDIPAAESPTIRRLAEAAVAKRGALDQQVDAGRELILFHAQAVPGAGSSRGAVWLMQRLLNENAYGELFGLGAVVLLLASTAVAAGAWLLTRRLDVGVSRIESGVAGMEHELDRPIPGVGIPELDRIGAAVERLGRALLENQSRRAELEQRLHQADRLAALGRLVAGVAHEVRNPLASIQLRLQLARRGAGVPDHLVPAFDVIQTEVDRLNRLVSRLLALGRPARPAAGGSTDLHRLLEERLELWRSRAASQGTDLSLEVAQSLRDGLHWDRDLLGQIVDNLVTNALDAVGQGGQVRVAAERSGQRVVLAVTDSGHGVPREDVKRIFEPFFTTRSEGTGLGLFLSAEMAQRLGGELRYVEPDGGGARFELSLSC